MSNLTDFFPSGGGGGLTPKFQEFTSSGFFTPSQALIDAGGYIEVFLVGGGGKSSSINDGSNGGEVLMKKMYLTIAQMNGVTVVIGSGTTVIGGSGGNSEFAASFGAGGVDLIASGGSPSLVQSSIASSSWGSRATYSFAYGFSAGNGIFGYGAGGASQDAGNGGGVSTGKANSGQGAARNGTTSGSGYCLIKWYE